MLSTPKSPAKGSIESRLGPIESVHRVRPGLRRSHVLMAFAALAGAIVAASVAAYWAFVAYTDFGPLLVGRWTGPPLLVALTLGGIGAWLTWRAWRTARLRIRLHSNGLAIVRGRRGRALAWDDVLTIWSRAERTGLPGLSGSPRLRLEIEANDGSRLRLSEGLEDFEALATAIKSRVYPSLLSAYSAAFNDRQAISFGPIALSQEGIRDRHRPPLAWPEVRAARLESGRLRIETSGTGRRSRLSIAARRIPNVELCLQLIQEIQAKA